MSYLPTLAGKLYYRTLTSDTLWCNPFISSNGTLGGSTFAVYTNYVVKKQGTGLWHAFDGSGGGMSSTQNTSGYFTFYNPTPVKAYGFHGSINWVSGIIYGSNDNATWTQLGTYSYTVSGYHDIPISTTNYYKYYKFTVTNGIGGSAPGLSGFCTLMGYIQTSTTEVVNSPDYTSSVDVNSGYVVMANGKTYRIEKGV